MSEHQSNLGLYESVYIDYKGSGLVLRRGKHPLAGALSRNRTNRALSFTLFSVSLIPPFYSCSLSDKGLARESIPPFSFLQRTYQGTPSELPKFRLF